MENKSSFPLGRVLIIDDESDLVSVLCEILTNMGYVTIGFVSGKEALNTIKEDNFDIILTDIMMPEMNGIELLKAAFQSDPNLVGILMTGQGAVQTAVEAIKMGAFDYILKPFDVDTLSSVLSRAMEMRKLKVENIQLHETIAIHELAKTIAVSFDVETILNKLADAAQKLVEADEVSIMLPVDEDKKELYIAVARGSHLVPFTDSHVFIEGSIAGWVANNLEALTFEGTVNDSRFQPIHPRNEICSAVSMPILSAGKFLGVLNVKTTHSRRTFTPGQVKGLSILASLVAPVLESSHLYQRIRQAEAKYRSLFENAVEGIFQTTPEGRFLSVNPSIAKLFGYDSPQEFIRQIIDIGGQHYVNPKDRETYKNILEREGIIKGFEVQLTNKEGDLLWASISARVVKDDKGGILHYEGTVENITERKLAIEALKGERFTLKEYIDNLPLLAYGISAEGKIISCNNMVLKTLGYDNRDELIGKSACMLYGPESQDEVSQMMERWKEKRKLINEECKIITKHGKILDVLLNIHAILDKNNIPLYFIATQLDITERKTMEETLKETVHKLKKATGGIIEVIVNSVEARDPYTSGHQIRVATLAVAIARAMGLSPHLIDGIQMAGMIHDLGKMSIPVEILSMPRKLTAIEYSLVKTHSMAGYNILKEINFTWPIAQIVLQHHERLDGSGYPHGLKGDEILPEAHIIAVADTIEAIASHRPYRCALGIDVALEEIEMNKNILYDAGVADVCVRLSREKGFPFY
jgi:PAS domain S-box-containing protein